MFAVGLVLPLLHPLRLTTAYTYLEKRFGLLVRCVGSALFILLRGGWLASVIYAPSLALSAVIPVPKIDAALVPLAELCGTNGSTIFWITVVGLGATIYTALGGLKAVIWTDMIQFFVFVGGLSAIWFLLLSELGTSTLLRELGKVPRAYAGNDFEAGWGKRVQLDGSLSRSFDGTPLEFSWRQLNRFTKIDHVHMEDPQTPRPTIVLPEKSGDVQSATLTFALRVTTSGNPPLQSPPSTVNVLVRDQPGVAATHPPPAYHDRPHDTWFDFSSKFVFTTGVTFWILFVGHLLSSVNSTATDQVALQRYFSASSLKNSKRALWLNAFCDVQLMPIMYLTGAGVLVYYAIHHHPNVPIDTAQAMPFFVAHKLNLVFPGLAGLFIATLFAATMSSIDSGINSISAAITTDWYRRLLVRDQEERHYLKAARWITLSLGLLATCVAVFLGSLGEIWQIAVALMGLWTGPLLGIFLLGFLTRRANTVGVLIGAAAGLVCTFVFHHANGNEFLYALVGLIPTLLLGYLTSIPGPLPQSKQISGLTYWTRKK